MKEPTPPIRSQTQSIDHSFSSSISPGTDRLWDLLAAILFAFSAAASAFHVPFAWPFIDEGWYLCAGREIWSGHWPFVHNFFAQGPAAAMLYAPVMKIAPGVLAGRIQACIFFLAALMPGTIGSLAITR